MYHAVRSLTNVSHSSLLASHTAAQSTQASWLPLLRGSSPTTTTTAGRMQAEKHRSALPCRLRSTAPRCPQVPFRRQALSQDTASRSTSHDWDPSEDVLFPMPGSNYRQDGSDEPCVAEAAAVGDQPPPPMQHPACQQPPPRPLHERAFAVRRASMKAHDVLIIHIRA